MEHLQQSASMPIDEAKCRRMENCFVRICNHTNSAIQLYRGKNSSDSAMIIDAMDLLYSDKVDGFVSFLVILILQD
jgi:hypothetical protein